ncbi:MAG: glycosyltransferase family 4 protein [Armatimonadota bacterium]
MRVGIDARPTQGSFTGDATYWRGLIEGLAGLDTEDEFILYYDKRLQEAVVPPSGHLRTHTLGAMNWRVWSAWAFPRALMTDGVKVAHVQYSIPPAIHCPVITSIHDVSFKRHPEFFSLKDRVILDMGVRHSGRRAARILAISEYTKKEICELYSINPEKVTVVYPGVDTQFKPQDRVSAKEMVKEKYGLDFPFVLSLGVIQPRKNLNRLLDAYVILKRDGNLNHKLVIAGKYGWKEANLKDRIEELGLRDDVVFTGYVPYEDLPNLYSAADLFVYPSVYEGFGLPPAEAMACGVPVITGNRSSLPEVVGEAGIMVDPYKPEEFADSIKRVLTDSSLYNMLSERGPAQAQKFSWDRMARQVVSIYHEVESSRH